MLFSKLKAYLRRIGARGFTALFDALGEVCNLFSPEECWNYFRQAGYVSMQDRKTLALASLQVLEDTVPQVLGKLGQAATKQVVDGDAPALRNDESRFRSQLFLAIDCLCIAAWIEPKAFGKGLPAQAQRMSQGFQAVSNADLVDLGQVVSIVHAG